MDELRIRKNNQRIISSSGITEKKTFFDLTGFSFFLFWVYFTSYRISIILLFTVIGATLLFFVDELFVLEVLFVLGKIFILDVSFV